MNKNIILMAIIIAVCASFVSCIRITNSSERKRGCGNVITSERAISAFNEINIRNSATVRFHKSEEFRVVVSVDENLYEYVEIDTRGSTLNIRTRSNPSDTRTNRNNRINININGGNQDGFSFTQFTVDVYAPTLRGVTVSGTGHFVNVDKLIVPSFEANMSGAGTIKGKIKSDNFSSRISGAGGITVSGSSQNADFRISGVGGFRGSDFIVNNATARVSGVGNMEIYVTDYLNANVSGVGSIHYRGNPRVESRVSGVGSVRRVN